MNNKHWQVRDGELGLPLVARLFFKRANESRALEEASAYLFLLFAGRPANKLALRVAESKSRRRKRAARPLQAKLKLKARKKRRSQKDNPKARTSFHLSVSIISRRWLQK